MKYFISFFTSKDANEKFGFGNVVIDYKKKIKGIEELDEIRDFIQEKENFENVVILNYQEMQHKTKGVK